LTARADKELSSMSPRRVLSERRWRVAVSPVWLTKLGQLNPAISRHKLNGKARYAPHKPLLLLCVLDLAENGEFKGPELGKTPELCLRFDSY